MTEILKIFPSEGALKKIIMETSATVWRHELSEKQIDRWLVNYKGDVFSLEEERIVSLWLLCHFVYYNEEEVKHLCSTLLKEYLHQMLVSSGDLESSIDRQIITILSNTAFLSLGEPSESGAFILYYFRQVNGLHMSYFLPLEQVEASNVERIVFIDDVTLTGGVEGQAYQFFRRFQSGNKKKFLLTFLATNEAVKELDTIGVHVISAITLDDRNKCFHKNSFIFHSFPEHAEACKIFVEHYGKRAKRNMPLGYENGEFTFGFFYNTPDNTLPIFWSTENGWHPIVTRYDKNYFQKKLAHDERFV